MEAPTQTRIRSAEWPQVLSGYAIQVRWSREPIDNSELRRLDLTNDMQVYTVRRAVGGRHAYGLRIGFFDSERQARLVIERLALAPRAGVVPVYETEVAKVMARTVTLTAPASEPKPIAQRPAAPTADAPRTNGSPSDAAQLKTLPPMTVDELLAVSEPSSPQRAHVARPAPPPSAPASARAPATAPIATIAPAPAAPLPPQARAVPAAAAPQPAVAKAPAAPAEAPRLPVAKAPAAPVEAPPPAVAKAPAAPVEAPAPDAPKPARAPRGDGGKDKNKEKRPQGHHIEHAATVAFDKNKRGSMSRTDWVLYTVLAVALTVGWQLRAEQYIVAEVGLGYALGIAGGTAMFALFLYPVRKRLRARWLGSIRSWFRVHIILGVVGPSLILFHSNFGTGSLNDNVALFAMLVVAGSGFFGRYFYAKIHYGLYGRKATLAELSRDVSEARKHHSAIDLVSKLNERLLAVETEVLKTPDTILQSAIRPLKLAFKTRWDFLVLRRFARAEIARQAKDSTLVAENLAELQKVAVNHIAERLQKIRKVAEFGFYDKLFSAWHVLHYPFFFVLVIAAVIHVVAVHFY